MRRRTGTAAASAVAAGAILAALLACAKGDPPMTSLRGRAAAAPSRDAAVAGAPDAQMVSARGGPPTAAGAKGVADDAFAALQAEDPHGGALRFKQFAGHVRVFDMWATWCGPCRMTIPELNKLYDRYRDRGLVVVGISVDDEPSEVVEFQRHVEMRYPSAMFNREIASRLGEPSAIPTTFLVDRSGRLRRTFVGYVSAATLEEEVRRLL